MMIHFCIDLFFGGGPVGQVETAKQHSLHAALHDSGGLYVPSGWPAPWREGGGHGQTAFCTPQKMRAQSQAHKQSQGSILHWRCFICFQRCLIIPISSDCLFIVFESLWFKQCTFEFTKRVATVWGLVRIVKLRWLMEVVRAAWVWRFWVQSPQHGICLMKEHELSNQWMRWG